MNLHTFPVALTPHRPLSFAILRTFAVVAMLGGFAPARAAGAAPQSSAAPGISDVVLARAALAALDAEAELKGVNLVVSVVDGVAVIGGPVPSTAVSRRAERIVRGVEGMKEVRNTCFVSTGPDPLLKAVAVKAGSSLPPPAGDGRTARRIDQSAASPGLSVPSQHGRLSRRDGLHGGGAEAAVIDRKFGKHPWRPRGAGRVGIPSRPRTADDRAGHPHERSAGWIAQRGE